jgi:hypothetical protein
MFLSSVIQTETVLAQYFCGFSALFLAIWTALVTVKSQKYLFNKSSNAN